MSQCSLKSGAADFVSICSVKGSPCREIKGLLTKSVEQPRTGYPDRGVLNTAARSGTFDRGATVGVLAESHINVPTGGRLGGGCAGR